MNPPAQLEPLERVRRHLRASAELQERVASACGVQILAAAQRIAGALAGGGKVMLCGNGGSAADSQHLAAEFTNRLSADFERPALAALALTTDSSYLTACANDRGFDGVFARQVEALGRAGDVLIVISTSGESINVVRAVEAGRSLRLGTIGLLGRGGGRVAPLVEIAIVVPSDDGQLVQESHIAIGHILVELVERFLFAGERHERRPG